MDRNKLIIKPPVLAHRGASRYAPENTMAAFEKAKALGITWVEFDVMLSQDDKVVVIHDETLDRTTDSSGYVCDFPYSYLETLDAGSWFHPNFSGQKIPLLSEVVLYLHKNRMAANVEVKSMPGKEELAVKKVMEVIQEYWTKEMTPPLLSSFSINILQILRRDYSDYPLGLLMHEWMPEWRKISDELKCVSVHLNVEIINQERILDVKSTGRQVLSYTVNEPARAKELFRWGVDAIYSDCPDLIC